MLALRDTLSDEAGAGRTEVVVGAVIVSREGRMRRLEIFEPEDEAALLQRFDELRTEDGN